MFGKIIFSILITECETEWMPEEDVLLGERWVTPSISARSQKKLKKLIYQPRKLEASKSINNIQRIFAKDPTNTPESWDSS